jgi:hypothetical protein
MIINRHGFTSREEFQWEEWAVLITTSVTNWQFNRQISFMRTHSVNPKEQSYAGYLESSEEYRTLMQRLKLTA